MKSISLVANLRKKGKLPCETISKEYDLEYGSAVIEMHKDSIKPGQKVVLVDDLIATGGTIRKIIPSSGKSGILLTYSSNLFILLCSFSKSNSILYYPEVNEYMGRRTVQLVVDAYR